MVALRACVQKLENASGVWKKSIIVLAVDQEPLLARQSRLCDLRLLRVVDGRRVAGSAIIAEMQAASGRVASAVGGHLLEARPAVFVLAAPPVKAATGRLIVHNHPDLQATFTYW